MSKSSKAGFIIKLSNETVTKLKTDEIQKPEENITNINQANLDTKSKQDEQNQIKISEDMQTDDRKEEDVKVIETYKKDKKIESEKAWGDYTPYITYEDNEAIYTDPTTQRKYIWSTESNSWVPKDGTDQSSDSSRVYSFENDTHEYTEPDGSKFFWDDTKKAWIPKVDDDFLAFYQMSYGFVDNKAKEEKKEEVATEPEKKPQPGVKRKSEPQWFDAPTDNNTKVYVSNLPLELTEEEFVDFMQKCGLVMRDPSTQKMKVKLYMDKEHNCFKGDALCTYIKVESVDLALKLLDGSDFKGQKVRVEKAQFELKGEYNPALKPKKKKKKELDKLKRMQEKLFDWRPEKFIGERAKHEKVVILKNVFQPSDFDKEVQLILDYQQDLREECAKCGEVRKVIIYDRHPEGVAQVTMKEPEQADAVVQLINNRWFGKRQLTAEIWDGRTKYKIAETDADINKRLDKWGRFLEQEEKNEAVVEKGEPVAEDEGKICEDKEQPSVDDNKID